ncbi:MAG TPA: helicase-related protein [Candidatus Saccharimonadales bacterium]|nr:helicase-related protein [Candidatus Saccharimonadales bacterium]
MSTSALPQLPIDAYCDRILQALRDHQVVIVRAETGAGKSTRVPRFLVDAGYDPLVTQPRGLAARTVAARVAQEHGTDLGQTFGFQVGKQRVRSNKTRCLFVTDGLALVHKLMGVGSRYNVLVLDEVHEWNLNIEVLVAWAKLQIQQNRRFRLVLMSATMEAEALAEYFDGAAIIDVPGRLFPVEEQAPVGPTLEHDVATLVKQGRNVLVFQPGKAEILATITRLRDMKLNAEILPLHGELTAEEQDRCFQAYDRPKVVVSTNVAQTSVTIPDIDAVVDGGMERRTELVFGIEGLYLRPISLADAKQRKGRAGRTKPGICIDWCQVPHNERLAFPLAEIHRTRLDQTVLRLALAGFDMEELRFFHQPQIAEIHRAKQSLRLLGCLDDGMRVTPIGHLVAQLPVSVQYARMIVEAQRLGVVDDVITIAAILEQGGINSRACPDCREASRKSCTCWRKALAPNETGSDVLAQLTAYTAAQSLKPKELMPLGIFVKAVKQVKSRCESLIDALKGKVKFGTTGNREDILKALCAGMVEHVFCMGDYGYQQSASHAPRRLTRDSVAHGADWLVGEPWDLHTTSREGEPFVLHLIRMATRVEPEWLIEVAPQLSQTITGLEPRYYPNFDAVFSTTEVWFNGHLVDRSDVLDPDHPHAAQLLRDGRNYQEWINWTNRPTIPLPDQSDPNAVIPHVVPAVYGMDADAGEPLLAYGTVAPCYTSAYSRFQILWTRDENEARQTRERAIRHLETIQEQMRAAARRARDAAEVTQLLSRIRPLQQQAEALLQIHRNNMYLSSDLRQRLVAATQLPWQSTPDSLQNWITRAEQVFADLTTALSAIEQREAQNAARLDQLTATARLLRDEANGLLHDRWYDLDDRSIPVLQELDVDDDQLPSSEYDLSLWVSQARQVIADASAALTGQVTSEDDDITREALLALAAKVNHRT